MNLIQNIPTVLEGPVDRHQIPNESLGLLIYNKLRKCDKNRIIMVDNTGEKISCEKFLNLSLNLASKLKEVGVKKGDIMTILSPNHYRYLLTIAAGFYLGAQVNLLNPDYTFRELKHFFEICRPVIIFCTSRNLYNVLKLKNEKFSLYDIIIYDEISDSQVTTFDEFLTDAPDFDIIPLDLDTKENVALIMTSSGTTGFPKCVQLTHFNIRVMVLCGIDSCFMNLNESTIVLEFGPFFHLLAGGTTLASLILGAKVIILDKFTPNSFLKSIQENKITKLIISPSVLNFLAKSSLVAQYDLSSLDDILCGGASVIKEFVEMVEKRLNVTVRQIWGMTEVGIVTVVPSKIKNYDSVGIVTTTFKIRICDPESDKELSANEIGELRIKGDGVMKGYLGNEKESREIFDEEGYLRSGDLGFYDEDGYFYIVDRLKDIIKYKGFQVSPAEIENLLVQHPAVKKAGVVGKPDERTGQLAVAFVVKQQNCKVTEEELINYVAENLSVQKHLHGGVRFIDEIPTSSTGKILRRKLMVHL